MKTLKKIITQFIICNLFFLNITFGFGIPKFISEPLESFGSKSSTINTYEKICNINLNTSNNPILEQEWQQICKIVKNSDACKDIKESRKVKCQSMQENEIDYTSWGFIKSCGIGFIKAVNELFDFIVEAAKWAWKFSSDSKSRSSSLTKGGEIYNMQINYLAVEFSKEISKDKYKVEGNANSWWYKRKEGVMETRATFVVAKKLLHSLFAKMAQSISDNFYELGCYNRKERAVEVCKFITSNLIPPAAALGLIFHSSKKTILKMIAKRKIKKKKNKKKDTKKIKKIKKITLKIEPTLTKTSKVTSKHTTNQATIIKASTEYSRYKEEVDNFFFNNSKKFQISPKDQEFANGAYIYLNKVLGKDPKEIQDIFTKASLECSIK